MHAAVYSLSLRVRVSVVDAQMCHTAAALALAIATRRRTSGMWLPSHWTRLPRYSTRQQFLTTLSPHLFHVRKRFLSLLKLVSFDIFFRCHMCSLYVPPVTAPCQVCFQVAPVARPHAYIPSGVVSHPAVGSNPVPGSCPTLSRTPWCFPCTHPPWACVRIVTSLPLISWSTGPGIDVAQSCRRRLGSLSHRTASLTSRCIRICSCTCA